MVRLRRTSPSSPGWTRVRHGRGFRYLDENGLPLAPEQVERCKLLVIPPAWTAVWICTVENGHLQAVGTDDAGRRQYIYHPGWRERRDIEKFQRMEGFAASLLKHRASSRRALGGDDLGFERVAATAFSLLDLGMFRIGSDRYVEENGSFGLTTLEKQHVRPAGQGLAFAYAAKSGQEVDVTIKDDRVKIVVETLRRRRGGGDRRDGRGRTSTRPTSTTTSRACWARTTRPRTSARGAAPRSPPCPWRAPTSPPSPSASDRSPRRCATCRSTSATPPRSPRRRTSILASSTSSRSASRSARTTVASRRARASAAPSSVTC
jgi:hypothetical protein